MTGIETASVDCGFSLVHAPRATGKFQRTYLGEPSQVRQVREDVAEVFGWCPMAEDLILAASELATNAIQHSRSGQGGQFTVTIYVRCGNYARIDVEDQGGRQAPHGADGSLGKGLAIVEALAGKGHWSLDPVARTMPSGGRRQSGQDAAGYVAWARIPWGVPHDTPGQYSADGAARLGFAAPLRSPSQVTVDDH